MIQYRRKAVLVFDRDRATWKKAEWDDLTG
jgi:hypothetical protein